MKNGYNEEKVSQVDNSKMIGGNNLLKMYVQERDYAVERKTAVFTSENLHDINLTWLALCIDGKLGDASVKEIKQNKKEVFWQFVQSNPTVY